MSRISGADLIHVQRVNHARALNDARLKAGSSKIRGRNGLMFQRFDAGKKTGDFLKNTYQAFKNFFRGDALRSDALIFGEILADSRIGADSSGALSRAMAATFDTQYRTIFNKAKAAGANDAKAHEKAVDLATEAAIAKVVVGEEDEGRWVSLETIQFLRQELANLKEAPQSKAEEERKERRDSVNSASSWYSAASVHLNPRNLPASHAETQHSRQQQVEEISHSARPDERRIDYADLGKRTANFFKSVWRESKELFLPVHALGEEQLQCVKFLREAGVGDSTSRLALAREMARAFNKEYSRVSVYGVLGSVETRRRASKAATEVAINRVIRRERTKGHPIYVEALDLLWQKLIGLKERPQPFA